jgi:hypothetical protein
MIWDNISDLWSMKVNLKLRIEASTNESVRPANELIFTGEMISVDGNILFLMHAGAMEKLHLEQNTTIEDSMEVR